jgi:hypothetical protein
LQGKRRSAEGVRRQTVARKIPMKKIIAFPTSNEIFITVENQHEKFSMKFLILNS